MGLTDMFRLAQALMGAAIITVLLCLIAPMMGRDRNRTFPEPVSAVLLTAFQRPEVLKKNTRVEPEKEPPPMRVETPRQKQLVEPRKFDLAMAPLQMEMPKVQAATMVIAPLKPQRQQQSGLGPTGIYDVGAVDTPPRLQRYSPPLYPSRAKGKKIEGKVVVRCVVTAGGRVKEKKIVSAEPKGYFERAALDAVAKWTFVAARHEGNKVSVYVDIPLSFTLE